MDIEEDITQLRLRFTNPTAYQSDLHPYPASKLSDHRKTRFQFYVFRWLLIVAPDRLQSVYPQIGLAAFLGHGRLLLFVDYCPLLLIIPRHGC